MTRRYGDPSAGKGATCGWAGAKSGTGSMDILQAAPGERLPIALTFLKPFKARNHAEFVLVPDGQATRATWSMTGKSPFISKVMDIFFNTDELVGKDFEKGLADLKIASEAAA